MRTETLSLLSAVGSTEAFHLQIRRGEPVRYQLFFTGTVGSGLSFRVEVSHDGVTWLPDGAAMTTLPNRFASTTPAKYVRVTATAGTGFSINTALVW